MFSNYVMAGIRNALRNRMHLVVNILGLTIGLTGFIFTQIFVDYEKNHDTFFENADRIFGVYIRTNPDGQIGVASTMGIQTAFAPLVKGNVEEIQEIARFDAREMVVGQGFDILYRQMQFVDPAFFNIFNLDFLVGDADRMDQPGNVVLSRSMAQTVFGHENVVGETLVVNTDHAVQVVGVFHDLPKNSHFMFSLINEPGFDIVASNETLINIEEIEEFDTWNNLNGSYRTYVLLEEGSDVPAIEQEFNDLTFSNVPSFYTDYFTSVGLRPLPEMNNYIWEAASFPMMPALQILGFVLLIIAVLNYTNLAGAKALLRSREVGMRKVMGASRKALMLQFVLEAILEAMVALILSAIAIEQLLPWFNDASGKALAFNVTSDITTLAWLVGVAMVTGIAAGLYPAYVLSGLQTIGALQGIATSGRIGRSVSAVMVALQFTLSITLVVTATLTFAQDEYLRDRDLGFNDENVLLVERAAEPAPLAVIDQIKSELEHIDGVEAVARSVWAPYEGSNSSGYYRKEGEGMEALVLIAKYWIDDDFLDLYEIPIIAGRALSRDIAGDYQEDVFASDETEGETKIREGNILLSRLAVEKMGFASPEEAVGQVLFEGNEETLVVATIVGVTEDFNYLAFQNDMPALAWQFAPQLLNTINIKYDPLKVSEVVKDVDRVWMEFVPTRPIERLFLSEKFMQMQRIFEGVTLGIVGFAVISTLVACIGLFALSAFLAERRTKEIGIRKVMGASVPRILGRLTWRLMMPAGVACLLGLPLGYGIAQLFNQFFADKVPLSVFFFIGPALLIIFIASATVAIHATRVSMAHPIKALRYE